MEKNIQVSLGGRLVSCSVRRSARAKNIIIRVSPDRGLEVVMPSGVKSYNLEECLKGREGWIITRLDQFERLKEKKANSGLVMFLGREYHLVTVIGKAAITVKILDDKIFVTVPDHSPETLAEALESWYRAQARIIFEERVRKINIEGFRVNRIFIRGQKTRWGSCSRMGNLNFNWRLVMAPMEVIDYIVVHELSHLKEMNHSINFWRLVESLCPDYKKYRRWLREKGCTLTLCPPATPDPLLSLKTF